MGVPARPGGLRPVRGRHVARGAARVRRRRGRPEVPAAQLPQYRVLRQRQGVVQARAARQAADHVAAGIAAHLQRCRHNNLPYCRPWPLKRHRVMPFLDDSGLLLDLSQNNQEAMKLFLVQVPKIPSIFFVTGITSPPF